MIHLAVDEWNHWHWRMMLKWWWLFPPCVCWPTHIGCRQWDLLSAKSLQLWLRLYLHCRYHWRWCQLYRDNKAITFKTNKQTHQNETKKSNNKTQRKKMEINKNNWHKQTNKLIGQTITKQINNEEHEFNEKI